MREEHKNGMPVWGPYSKKYMGLSRIMKESEISGARFDLAVYPTYANSAVPVPNVTVPSDYHPWDCDTKSMFFRYRYELLWKDQLYADVDFFQIEEETWGIRVFYVNRTSKIQNCLLNFFSAVEYPKKWIVRPVLPQKSEFWNALDYERFSFARKRPWEHLMPDGLRWGEVPEPSFTDGSALGETLYHLIVPHFGLKWFGSEKGDQVFWRRKVEHSYQNAVLTIRYMTNQNHETVCFATDYGMLEFTACRTPQTVRLSLGRLAAGEFELHMTAEGTKSNGVMLDCLCITEEDEAQNMQIIQNKLNVIPQIHYQDGHVAYQYNYGEAPVYFTILNKRVRSRKLYSGCLEDALITRLTNSDETYDNLTRSFTGAFSEKHSDDGFYHTNVAEAIFLPGESTRTEYAYISTQNKQYTKKELEQVWAKRSACTKEQNWNPEGEGYQFSARLMKAALFSNVVYPIYRYGEPIAHYTPGKRWDSLYTWDSGFIGLGMLDYSEETAEYIMDTYLSEEQNQDFAFLFHGSMIPTQFYLYYEMLQRASKEKREAFRKYYAMFRRAYLYMAGKTEGSTTGRLPGNLKTAYDYFYNASGMDDYPPQVYLHRQHLEQYVSPVCSNAHFIRFGKIMSSIARQYGYEQDSLEYEEDWKKTAESLLKHAWDEESGYFGYAVYRDETNKWEILRTNSGENYNKGIDGVTPLFAGICNRQQEERMLAHLKSDKELWSAVGISTVDMSAEYYYDNGYWNGSVWFPYQYLLWKAMLDIGDSEMAFCIADRALHAWKQEVEFSYNTFEMIQIETERGGWFHQFGGLSSPIVIWYHAYYRPGTVTGGFETWIESSSFYEGHTQARITYRLNAKKRNTIIAVMDSGREYKVLVNGKPAQKAEHVKGALEIFLEDSEGEILIQSEE